MKAKWGLDYDYINDECFKRPSCPKCAEEYGCVPVLPNDKGEYRCINCQEIVELDEKQKQWIDDRCGAKVEIEDCLSDKEVECDGKKIRLGCGGKKCVESTYFKNDVTLKWQLATSVCKNCGRRIIV